MIKSAIKWAISGTPWRIVRAETVNDSYKKDEAINHNLMEGWNEKFQDPNILEQYYSPARHRLNTEILKAINDSRDLQDDEIIGDVGCGLGHFLEMASQQFNGAHFFGYDFSTAGLEAAKLRCPRAVFERQDIYDILPRLHHVTVCSQTLEHLLDPYLAARNLVQGTQKGGIAVFTVPDGRLDTYKGHINFWSPESWEVWIRSVADDQPFRCYRMPDGTAGGANLISVISC